jgi:uncharacterized damage-inducible protein DinB
VWKHLFLDGEFRQREQILSGLTLEQVTQRPAGASHSIYQELWHATAWQRIVVEGDEAGGEAWMSGGPGFPSDLPESEGAWQDLVSAFLAGAEKAVDLGQSPERLKAEVDPGGTMADELHSLAVHNAYHLGKIVALRQVIGAWPPPT